MNEFTKEELIEIWESLDVERLQNGVYVYTDLMNKIQFMIDNYCEHESLKKQITRAIDSCKAYGTKESEMIIFAYQNVLRWMANYDHK